MGNEPEQPSELMRAIQSVFAALAEPIHTELLDISARLSAQRYLLEIVYANEFLNNEDGFNRLMESALDQTRQKATKSGPMPDEVATELQARIATHLQRFQESTALRIREGIQD